MRERLPDSSVTSEKQEMKPTMDLEKGEKVTLALGKGEKVTMALGEGH